MLPAGLLAALGLDIAFLESTAGMAAELIDIGAIAAGGASPGQTYARFTKLMFATQPGMSFQLVAQYWKAAKYWADQGSYLGMYAGNVTIDPSLSQTIQRPLSERDPAVRYRYQVEVSYRNTQTGETIRIDRWYKSSFPLSQGEVFNAVEADIFGEFEEATLPGGSKDERIFGIESMTLQGFARYQYGPKA